MLILVVVSGLLFIGANSRNSQSVCEYATVDTDPGAPGYYTNEVSAKEKRADKLFFSIRKPGVMTITLQFKCINDSDWTDYDTYTAVGRHVLDDNANAVVWRAGVVNSAAYTSGIKTFGFDWK